MGGESEKYYEEAGIVELTDIVNKLLDVLKIDDIKDMPDALFDAVINHNTDVYNAYIEAVDGNLNTDHLQNIYQYYFANREELGQDFTPESLAKLLSELTKDEEEVIDLCSGSGALTIQAWTANPERRFTCYEIDETTVKFLLFNLAVRNISGRVYHQDLFDDSKLKIYEIKASEKYSEVQNVGNNQ